MDNSFKIDGPHGVIQVHLLGTADIRSKRGLPVVALHGFTGSGLDFAPVVSAVGAEDDWVALDLPGHGGSYCGANFDHYSLNACIENLDIVLNHLQIDRFCLLGYSMGGRIALHYAFHNPERLQRLIVVSASPGLAEAKARTDRCGRDEQLAHTILNEGVPAFVQQWQNMPLIQSQQTIPQKIRIPMFERRMDNSAWGLAHSLRGVGTGVLPSLWHALPNLSVNTCLVSGAKDEKFTAITTTMAAQMPLAQQIIIEGAGHAPHLEAVEAFAREVLDDISK